jgi:hypothetical protein
MHSLSQAFALGGVELAYSRGRLPPIPPDTVVKTGRWSTIRSSMNFYPGFNRGGSDEPWCGFDADYVAQPDSAKSFPSGGMFVAVVVPFWFLASVLLVAPTCGCGNTVSIAGRARGDCARLAGTTYVPARTVAPSAALSGRTRAALSSAQTFPLPTCRLFRLGSSVNVWYKNGLAQAGRLESGDVR